MDFSKVTIRLNNTDEIKKEICDNTYFTDSTMAYTSNELNNQFIGITFTFDADYFIPVRTNNSFSPTMTIIPNTNGF